MKSVNVVAGIIWNQDRSQILIAKRPDHLHKGGFWEFPGGKVEAGETKLDALKRELKEELSIEFRSSLFFQNIHFEYPEKIVNLDFYHVYGVTSDVRANEGQQWVWVDVTALSQYTFPEANEPIIAALMQG